MTRHVSMLVKSVNEINYGVIDRRWGWRGVPYELWVRKRKGADSGMLVVVGSTDTPTWICPGDWDQILHLSKATQHQRHSNEVVLYCKLSSRAVCVSVCVHRCKFLFVLVRGEKVTKKKNQNWLKERCVGLSFLSASGRSVHTPYLCKHHC